MRYLAAASEWPMTPHGREASGLGLVVASSRRVGAGVGAGEASPYALPAQTC